MSKNPLSTKQTALVAVAAVDLIRQLSRVHAARVEQENRSPAEYAAYAKDRASDLLSRPWRSDPAEERRRTALMVSGISAAALVAAAIGLAVAGRKYTDSPSPIDRAKAAAAETPGGAVTAAPAVAKAVATSMKYDVSQGVAAGKQLATDAVSERVVDPAVSKAKRYSALAIAGLTVYVIVIAALVQLAVVWLT